MDIKKQVLSIEQMQHLKRLGLDTSDATMCWIKTPKGRDVAFNDDWIDRRESLLDPIPAYTLQDILEKLPNRIEIKGSICDLIIYHHEDGVSVYYDDNDFTQSTLFCKPTLLKSAYEMLCWCIEQGFIKTGKEETK